MNLKQKILLYFIESNRVMNSVVPNIAYSNQIKGVITLFLTNFKRKVIVPKPITWDHGIK